MQRVPPRRTSHSHSLQGGEDDIDALLAQFKLQDEASTTVRVEDNCRPPSPRVYASFLPMVSPLQALA
jgi:hypothetical protein